LPWPIRKRWSTSIGWPWPTTSSFLSQSRTGPLAGCAFQPSLFDVGEQMLLPGCSSPRPCRALFRIQSRRGSCRKALGDGRAPHRHGYRDPR
jgi:hypothetical protein